MSSPQSHPGTRDGYLPGAEAFAAEVADRYRVHVDASRPGGMLRYVAVARRLDIRPYAVVTTDPAELLAALAGRSREPAALRSQRQPGIQ